jgi:hypothetical protein
MMNVEIIQYRKLISIKIISMSRGVHFNPELHVPPVIELSLGQKTKLLSRPQSEAPAAVEYGQCVELG